MKHIIALSVAVVLSGCGTLEGKFQNDVAVSLGCDRVYTVSEYLGLIGITGRLRDETAKAISAATCARTSPTSAQQQPQR